MNIERGLEDLSKVWRLKRILERERERCKEEDKGRPRTGGREEVLRLNKKWQPSNEAPSFISDLQVGL